MIAGRILVLGGAGFLGRHLVARLAERGRRVLVATRRRERAKHLLPLPSVEVVEANCLRDDELARLVGMVSAVVNLVGILHDRDRTAPFGRAFADVHVELPRRLGATAAGAGVTRLVHVSALGATGDGPSAYLRSKAAGEAALRQVFPSATVLRPSVIFGPEDRFLNLFAALQARLPFLLLPCAAARFQPIYVGDVAAAIDTCISASAGESYDLCGPRVYTLAELARYAGALAGVERPIVPLGETLALIQAGLLEFLPGPPMSRDNVLSMRRPSICSGPSAPELGLQLAALEERAPDYLRPFSGRPGAARHRIRRRS